MPQPISSTVRAPNSLASADISVKIIALGPLPVVDLGQPPLRDSRISHPAQPRPTRTAARAAHISAILIQTPSHRNQDSIHNDCFRHARYRVHGRKRSGNDTCNQGQGQAAFLPRPDRGGGEPPGHNRTRHLSHGQRRRSQRRRSASPRTRPRPTRSPATPGSTAATSRVTTTSTPRTAAASAVTASSPSTGIYQVEFANMWSIARNVGVQVTPYSAARTCAALGLGGRRDANCGSWWTAIDLSGTLSDGELQRDRHPSDQPRRTACSTTHSTTSPTPPGR